MTIEQAPSTNGRTSTDQSYAPPSPQPAPQVTADHRHIRPRRPGLARLVMPVLFAVAITVVMRRLSERAGDPGRDS